MHLRHWSNATFTPNTIPASILDLPLLFWHFRLDYCLDPLRVKKWHGGGWTIRPYTVWQDRMGCFYRSWAKTESRLVDLMQILAKVWIFKVWKIATWSPKHTAARLNTWILWTYSLSANLCSSVVHLTQQCQTRNPWPHPTSQMVWSSPVMKRKNI